MLTICKLIKEAVIPGDDKKKTKLKAILKKAYNADQRIQNSDELDCDLLYNEIEKRGGWKTPEDKDACIGLDWYDPMYPFPELQDLVPDGNAICIHHDMGELHIGIINATY